MNQKGREGRTNLHFTLFNLKSWIRPCCCNHRGDHCVRNSVKLNQRR